MPVYWSMLIFSIIILFFGQQATRTLYTSNNQAVYNTSRILVFTSALYIAFFICLRDEVLDTYAYIATFKNIPTDWNRILAEASDIHTAKGFYYIQSFFKYFISENHYAWLSFLCLISIGCLFRTYRKYSCDYPLTFFLFIASTTFSWLLNGVRQFVVVCILFAFIDWLLGDWKQKIKYLVLILFLSMIHSSCIIMIPICVLCSRGKLLDKWMIFMVATTIIGTIFFDRVMGQTMALVGKDYTEAIETGSGSNIFRFFISAVPVILMLFRLKQVKTQTTPVITLAINMSLAGACFFFASTFTNGILIGRMPIYFTIYNFFLLPWLIKNCYPSE